MRRSFLVTCDLINYQVEVECRNINIEIKRKG